MEISDAIKQMKADVLTSRLLTLDKLKIAEVAKFLDDGYADFLNQFIDYQSDDTLSYDFKNGYKRAIFDMQFLIANLIEAKLKESKS